MSYAEVAKAEMSPEERIHEASEAVKGASINLAKAAQDAFATRQQAALSMANLEVAQREYDSTLQALRQVLDSLDLSVSYPMPGR